MMALTYAKVTTVISKPPDKRADFEVNNLLSWFRKKSDLFRTLKTDLLLDLIKHLQFVTKDPDEVIIKQGEQGDCMYIVLRGQVTIFIQYAPKKEGEEDKPVLPEVLPTESEELRKALGTYVTSLGAGATFGEVALLSVDCVRTASIVTDETTDLIVVDRKLYNRSVKAVQLQEFQDKVDFIARSGFFHNWAPKYRKQLTMALEKEVYPYEAVMAKQGDKPRGIYFILKGEVKLLMDSCLHKTQYPKLLHQDQHFGFPRPHSRPKDPTQEAAIELIRRSKVRKQVEEVCLLGVNETIGEIETLMDLDTYMQTAVCTQRTEVLILERKHYERLFVRRNPKTIDAMKSSLQTRIQARSSKARTKTMPIMRCLLDKVVEFNRLREQNKPLSRANNHKASSFDLPPRGPLVDIHGPGTVFHRIRRREQAKNRRQKREKLTPKPTLYNPLAVLHQARTVEASSATSSSQNQPSQASTHTEDVYDPVMNHLENRMRLWLSSGVTQKAIPVRIERLRRSHIEAADLKPGARVLLIRKPSASFTLQSNTESQEEPPGETKPFIRGEPGTKSEPNISSLPVLGSQPTTRSEPGMGIQEPLSNPHINTLET